MTAFCVLNVKKRKSDAIKLGCQSEERYGCGLPLAGADAQNGIK